MQNSIGLGFVTDKRLLVVGDSLKHRIVVFKFNSCFDITKKYELKLPEKLKAITNLTVDKEDRLWVSTEEPDDYTNASLFMWASDQWLR